VATSHTTIRQRLWRWHFYAGLIVCPFAILLAITGAIYLFYPQIEGYQEAKINDMGLAVKAVPENLAPENLVYEHYLHNLLAENSGAVFRRLILNKQNDRTVEAELQHVDGTVITYWIDIYSGQVLAQKPNQDRLMHVIKKLHSELLLGNAGSYIVELMASWLIILIVSGLYLWLVQPTDRKKTVTIKQQIFPQIDKKSPVRQWRSFRGVLGLWFTVPILILLLSGLPWTQLWGSGFNEIKNWLGWQAPGQQWVVTLTSTLPEDEHAEHGVRSEFNSVLWEINSDKAEVLSQTDQAALASITAKKSLITLDDIRLKLEVSELHHPIHIMPPKSDQGVWSVRSMSAQRSQRVTLHYDQYTGEQVMRIGFEDHHPIQRFVSNGVSLHEGALFGWLNQLFGVLTALAVVGISGFGLYLWWLRKPSGQLGAPAKLMKPTPKTFVAVIGCLAIFLPAAGLSFLVILLLEWLWVNYIVQTLSRRKNAAEK